MFLLLYVNIAICGEEKLTISAWNVEWSDDTIDITTDGVQFARKLNVPSLWYM